MYIVLCMYIERDRSIPIEPYTTRYRLYPVCGTFVGLNPKPQTLRESDPRFANDSWMPFDTDNPEDPGLRNPEHVGVWALLFRVWGLGSGV